MKYLCLLMIGLLSSCSSVDLEKENQSLKERVAYLESDKYKDEIFAKMLEIDWDKESRKFEDNSLEQRKEAILILRRNRRSSELVHDHARKMKFKALGAELLKTEEEILAHELFFEYMYELYLYKLEEALTHIEGAKYRLLK